MDKNFVKLDRYGFVRTKEFELGDYSELSKDYDHVVNTVTSCAAISRGNNRSKNPHVRFKKLLKEAAVDLNLDQIHKIAYSQEAPEPLHNAGRPLEYAPAVLKFDCLEKGRVQIVNLKGKELAVFSMAKFNNLIGRHSYIDEDDLTIYTNMRTIVNAGFKIEDVVGDFPDYYEKYFIVEIKAPYFVFAQIRTHGLLTQVAESVRVLTNEDYWLPEDIVDRLKDLLTEEYFAVSEIDEYGQGGLGTKLLNAETLDNVVDAFLQLPVGVVVQLFKDMGYKKEIYNRWPNLMEYKTWIIGGWINDPKQWGHFLLEREAYPGISSSWVQKETQQIASAVRVVIERYLETIKK